MAAAPPISSSFVLIFFAIIVARSHAFEFIGFNNSESKLFLEEALVMKPSGALRLTDRSEHVIGHAFYHEPIQMFEKNSPNASSFSTYFVFTMVTPPKKRGGYGLAFTISPSNQFPGAEAEQYLGIFNSSNDNSSSNHVFAVEFDTVNGFMADSDSEGNHVGINVNSMFSLATQSASYYVNSFRTEEIDLKSGDPIQAWIEYNGTSRVVDVTIAPITVEKPIRPLVSFTYDLSGVFQQSMYVGFSASTGKKASSHYILGWSFQMNGTAPPLDLSKLPPPPKDYGTSSLRHRIIAFIGALTGVILLLGIWFLVWLYRKKRQPEVLEDWELDCPHRFRYNDLHKATKGFKESEMIGVGGFGTVYKGVLPSTGCEVAVKKITRNSIQGMREFAAEVESLGRLRHKNLVNLQGWCKKKDDLLLIYDYIPYGSLDSLLYNAKNNFVLSWEQRCNILKGIAAGLLYLHEEWEQVVIHRDVKSSNVLIDGEMNARLGDFGLARLYDHGQDSHTTNVVGTIGYIAPELARTGKASSSSDVFAYGVLLLEVASGRRPINTDSKSGYFVLVDWVMECQQMGIILDAVDPKLNSTYVVKEMELVLRLGLLCSQPKQAARPTMRQVTRFLNGDDPLPDIDDWRSSIDSFDKLTARFLEVMSNDSITRSNPSSSVTVDSFNKLTARFLEVMSNDSITRSNPSSSVTGISSTSIDGGR